MMSAGERENLPLVSAQVGIWLAQQLDPSRADYRIAEYFDIRGDLDPDCFRAALRALQAETETLNVRFVERDGEARQELVAVTDEDVCEVVDLTSRSDPPAAALAMMREALAQPVDLAEGRLGIVVLYRLGPERHFFLHSRHHLIADGVTGSLLSRRIAEIYTALVEGTGIPAAAPSSARRMVEIDRDYRASEAFAEDRAYWTARLADAPAPVPSPFSTTAACIQCMSVRTCPARTHLATRSPNSCAPNPSATRTTYPSCRPGSSRRARSARSSNTPRHNTRGTGTPSPRRKTTVRSQSRQRPSPSHTEKP